MMVSGSEETTGYPLATADSNTMTETAPGPETSRLADVPVRPRRRPWNLVIAALVILIAVYLVQLVVRNPVMQWDVIRHYLLDADIVKGAQITVLLTVATMALSVLLGAVIATMRLSESRLQNRLGAAYVWFFRSVPLLVLLLVLYNLALFFPRLSLGVPFGGPTAFSVASQNLVTPFAAALTAFTLNETSNAAEIFRSSILSVHRGQWEAAAAIGMPRRQAFRRIIFPQAFRVAVPPLGNDAVNVLKNTAVVAFIGVSDLLFSAQQIYTANYLVVPLLVVVSIWYLVLVSITTALQVVLERRSAKKGVWRPRSRMANNLMRRAS